MTRLLLLGAIAIIVLAISIGLIWVMDKQDRDDLAQSAAPAPSSRPVQSVAGGSSQGAAPTQGADEAQAQAVPAIAPSFDIVRVNPSGDAVIAGRAGRGDTVTILDNGAAIGSVEADDNGEWVFLPSSALNPGEHSLTLESRPGDNGEIAISERKVVIVVPEIAKDIAGKPVDAPAGALAVELPASGGGAVRVLNLPGRAGATEEGGQLLISAVDYGDQGLTVFSGRAPANSRLIAYLNNQPVADVAADDRGNWSIDQASPVGEGPHRFRLDQVDAEGKVLARAEIMFELVPPGGAGSLPEGAEGDVVVVQPGQSLWLLARRSYGEGMRYTIIFDANRSQIADPDLIFPGQVLHLPPG